MIERNFKIPFVSRLALSEKQIQQNYRPLIAIHKWFARRPGTLFRSLILSEFSEGNLEQEFFRSHSFGDKHVLDPFMGGGTTIVEANRLGCDVTGTDINPMAWWIVRQEILDLSLDAYREAVSELRSYLREQIGHLFETKCPKTGATASTKYHLWVKTSECPSCGHRHRLFPNYLIAQDVRHTAYVFFCDDCDELYESDSRDSNCPCPHCGIASSSLHLAKRNRSRCRKCDTEIKYPNSKAPEHELFAIEYHLDAPSNGVRKKGRYFKAVDDDDRARYAEAVSRLEELAPEFIPPDSIPAGDESERLHRWGYKKYNELFNARQLLGLELSARWIRKVKDQAVREALATNFSDLLRYQNMLCRYDTMALKSLDIFSVHGFPVGLVQCESNFLGIMGNRGKPVGSGGWVNITEKFSKAKQYCSSPFEIRRSGNKKQQVYIENEWIGTSRNGTHPPEERTVNLRCEPFGKPSENEAYDAVFTDPPYFGNVQYAELMDFCYVWLRKLLGGDHDEFKAESTRNAGELTGNLNMRRDLSHFTEGISKAYCNAAKSLKSGGPLAFTYHHNKLEAYIPLAVAILDAGLVCSASLPCPAEMGASIHINGTKSSIVDTVFVCRATGKTLRRWIVKSPAELADLLANEIDQLMLGGLKPTQGDIRCICNGHLTRLAIWQLKSQWEPTLPVMERMAAIRRWFGEFGGAEAVLSNMGGKFADSVSRQKWMLAEQPKAYDSDPDEISF